MLRRRPVQGSAPKLPTMKLNLEKPETEQNTQQKQTFQPLQNPKFEILQPNSDNSLVKTPSMNTRTIPFQKPKEIAKKERKEKDYSYSYSDSYYSDSYSYSDNENDDNQLMDLVFLFQGLSMKISERNNEEEINKLEEDLQNEHKKLNEINKELLAQQKSIDEIILSDKIFFTELFDFFAHQPEDLSTVEDEFLDVAGVLDRLRRLRKLDPIQYTESGLSKSVTSIISYFSDIELASWDFLSRVPLLDMRWIRAGWFWEKEDGNADLVPSIFDNLVPTFVEKLSTSNLQCESDFVAAYVHCVEICDYCNDFRIAGIQLNGAFQRKIVDSVNRKIITKKQYESILDSIESYGSLVQ